MQRQEPDQKDVDHEEEPGYHLREREYEVDDEYDGEDEARLPRMEAADNDLLATGLNFQRNATSPVQRYILLGKF